MTDLAHPHDDPLAAQLAARESASRQDAAVLGPLRSAAAARALGFEVAATGVGDPILGAPTAKSTMSAPASAEVPAAPTAPSTGASPGPWPMPGPEPVQPRSREFTPPGVVLPAGGPASVTTGVLAAAAARRGRAERPVMELRPTVLATDIDRIGDQLVVLKDRLELRDRHNGLRRTLPLAEIGDVQVQRRLTSAVLVVKSRTTADMVIKGLRPEAAESAREAILRLRPDDAPYVDRIDERALMRSLVELHRSGVIDDLELAEKTALVARLAGRSSDR